MRDFVLKVVRKLLTREVITYLIFGVLTTVVNFLAFYLLNTLLGIHYLWANALAWVAAVAFAFVTNKHFVFDSRCWKLRVVVGELIGFAGGRVLSLLLEQGGLLLFVELWRMNEMFAKLILAVAVIIMNYFISKLIVFSKKRT